MTWSGQPCQKQESRNTAILARGKTKSARRGIGDTKASLVGAVAAISLIGASSGLAAPPAGADASCVGRLASFFAQQQLQDETAHAVKLLPGPPGATVSHVAREHEGETPAECLAETP